MFDNIEQEIIRFQRNKSPFCIMMSDIDFFKKINDEFGHAAGDHILIEYSKINKKKLQTVRPNRSLGGRRVSNFTTRNRPQWRSNFVRKASPKN